MPPGSNTGRQRGVLVAAATLVLFAVAPASARAASVQADFNDDGFADLAIGAPFEVVGGAGDAGAVNVIYGSVDGLSATAVRPDQFWTQNTANVNDAAEAGDNFGLALAVGDFNGDGFTDLAIGAPGEDVGGLNAAGAVHVIYGSANGLSATAQHADQLWTQNSTDVADTVEENDRFGTVLAAANFGSGSQADLAIGAPLEDLGNLNAAGAVHVIYGSGTGLSATAARADQFWTQNSPDVEDSAEPGDQYGASLAAANLGSGSQADLAIGVPQEGLAGPALAGAVSVLYGSGNGLSATAARADQLWTQNSANVEDSAESGDQFGSSLVSANFGAGDQADLAIGVPLENVGALSNAGAVNVIYGSSNGLSATAAHADQLWTQNSANVDDVAEADDVFGGELGAGNFGAGSQADLAIGVPGEDLGAVSSAGAVHVVYGSADGLSTMAAAADQFWTQDSPDVEEVAEDSDSFGGTLVAGNFGAGDQADLAVGAPLEDLGAFSSAGAVNVIYGSADGLSATTTADQLWTQDSPGIEDAAEQADRFGGALAALR
jgi:FG-GAP repeat protein